MQFIKRIAIITSAIASLLIPATAAAQFRLPAQHADRHNSLIANQRPAGVNIEKFKFQALTNHHKPAAVSEDLAELFNYNWECQSIATAYSGLTVPQTCDIDVSGYVAPVRGVVTSGYGYRPRFGRMHKGVDLNLNVGDTVVAAFDGRVRITKFERRGYGYYVVVRHDNGLETVYGHLSRFLVKPNQFVKAGEPIALGGNTGRSTGPHLHFETRFMGLAINPATIIDFENYVPHKDVFAFDKNSYDKSQKYKPYKKGKKKYAKKRKSRKGKSTASSRKKKSSRRR